MELLDERYDDAVNAVNAVNEKLADVAKEELNVELAFEAKDAVIANPDDGAKAGKHSQ